MEKFQTKERKKIQPVPITYFKFFNFKFHNPMSCLIHKMLNKNS